MWHCTGLCPASGSTEFSCVTHASGVKYTLDGVQYGAILEELLDQGTQCCGAGHVGIRLAKQVVSQGRWYHGVRTRCRRQCQRGEILQQQRRERGWDGVLTTFRGRLFCI